MDAEYTVYEDLTYDLLDGEDLYRSEMDILVARLSPLESDAQHYSVQFVDGEMLVYLWDSEKGVPVE